MSNLNLNSPLPPSEWRGDITIFNGFYDTIPADKKPDMNWALLVESVAPHAGPKLIRRKDAAPYFVPCSLREAPYLAQTLERARREGWPSLSGKQRSASHVTESALLKFDLDGMSEAQWASVLDKLHASGLAFLAFSTWSLGLVEKPGVRVRVLISMDKALWQAEYELAWCGAAEMLFSELREALSPDGKKILDPSAAKICQQQSVFCTSPDRKHLAFRIVGEGGIASADDLMAAAPVTPAKHPQHYFATGGLNAALGFAPDLARVYAAILWINPDEYPVWIKTGLALRSLAAGIGESNALSIWLEYSERGSEDSKKQNKDRYSPQVKWETFSPTMPPDAAAGTLFGMARDGALAALEADRGKPALSDRGRAAAKYLAANHWKLFNELKGA